MTKTCPDIVDVKGKKVLLGSFVRVLNLDEKIYDDIPQEEIEYIRSMIGEVFEIEEIDNYSQPWVTKWWLFDNGSSRCHSIPLRSQDMEVIEEVTSK